MGYPENDTQFEDKIIERVGGSSESEYDITCDGWTLWCGKECPVVPVTGQTARFYGRGIGAPVRGLFIDGVKVWYRTEAEDKEHSEIQLYGADATDWLARWDNGRSVWSIEMGGMGPGYEQCIQITAAELLRLMLKHQFNADLWKDSDVWKRDRDQIDKEVFEVPAVKALGLSGAQFGAAMSLASRIYMDGPRKVMSTPEIKDRHIQVRRTFPGMAA